MTIVFQGHVQSVEGDAPIGKLKVTLRTPMAEANGRDWSIFIPENDVGHWLVGSMVSFTIYTMPKTSPQTS